MALQPETAQPDQFGEWRQNTDGSWRLYRDLGGASARNLAGAGGPPSGAAGGDLTGNYPSPQIAAGVIVDADVNASAAIQPSKIAGLSTAMVPTGGVTGQPLVKNSATNGDASWQEPEALVFGDTSTGTSPRAQFNGSGWLQVTGAQGPTKGVNYGQWANGALLQSFDGATNVNVLQSTPAAGPIVLGTKDAAQVEQSIIIAGTTKIQRKDGTPFLASANDDAVVKQHLDSTISTHVGAADPHTGYQKESEKAVANGYAPLDASNLIPTTHLPPLAINDVFTVASEAAMLALTAQVGDMAIRTDTGKTYVLSASPASTLGNWKEIMATGQVVSVNGATGVVSITAASLGVPPNARQIISGNGLTGGGDLSADRTLAVVGDATLNVTADQVAVVSAPKWTTARSITLTGDVTGTVASVDGSANVSIATTVAGAGTGAKHFAGNVAAGAAVVVNHALNSRDVSVEVYRNSTPWDTVLCDVERTDVNNVTLRFASAVSANAYRCVVMGR